MADKPVKVHFIKEGKIDVLRPMSDVEIKAISDVKEEVTMTTEMILSQGW